MCWASDPALNPEETQTWAFAASGKARKTEAEINKKSVTAWGNGLAIAPPPNLPKSLRMGRSFRGFHDEISRESGLLEFYLLFRRLNYQRDESLVTISKTSPLRRGMR
jgi:hypothetical protein